MYISELLLEPEFSPVWSQYIGLLIPHDDTHKFLFDASYVGIGSWSPDFKVHWHVPYNALISLSFSKKIIDCYVGEPLDAGSNGLHINPWNSGPVLLTYGC
jgi:hypothetical protein